MMTNYSDWKVWREVELFTEAEYLSEYTEYQVDTLLQIFEHLFDKGKKEGLEGCFLKFSSTRESYEDFLGPVQVTVCGYRKLNAEEKEELQREQAINELAEELCISYYEASTLFSLKERGKLK
jgi:hypothetical protein